MIDPRHFARERNKYARDAIKFVPFIEIPFDLSSGAFIMPANGRIGIACDADILDDTVTVTINGTRVLGPVPATPAGQVYRLDYIERGQTVQVDNTGSGQISLYYLDQWMEASKIAGLASMPPGALGIWYMDAYTATPTPMVPNAVSTIAASQNLLRAPRRLFSSGLFWSKNGGPVLVDGVADGPDGSSGAASSLTATGNFNMLPDASPTLVAGEYTLGVWAKRNTGTDQQFALQFYGVSSSPTKTATSVWQRFSFTSTLGDGNANPLIGSFDGSTGADIQICDLTLYAGAVDLGEPVQSLHMYLGLNNNTSQMPTYSSGALDFSSGPKIGLIQFAAQETILEATTIAFAKQIGSGNNFHAFLSKIQGYTEFTGLINENGWPDFFYGGQNVDNNAFSTPSGWHMITQLYNGSNIQVWVDDFKVIDLPITPGSVNLADLVVGYLNGGGNQFPTDYAYATIALYDRALSATEIKQAYSVLTTRLAKSSNVAALVSRFVVADGDSITSAVFFVGYPKVYGAANSNTATVVDYAVSGSVIANLVARAPVIDSLLTIKTGRKNILTSLTGHNDLNNPGAVAQFLSDYAAYCDARRAAGYLVVICTILTGTDSRFNIDRATCNAAFRTWIGSHCDAIIDFDTTVMGVDGNASDTSLFVDGTHPTQAGQNILETLYATVINGM